MALPSSGAISFSAINTEIGLASTAQLDLNNFELRNLTEGTTGTQVSITAGYGKSYTGLYYYPRQTTTWEFTAQAPSRANYRLITGLDSNGGMGGYVDSGTQISKTIPTRWYTPLTANISSSYQMNIFNTGFSQTGPGSFNFTVYVNGITNAGQMSASSNSTFGWTGFTGGASIYFSQSLVNPGGAYDATATGTIQIRQTSTPSNITSIPFSFRLYAL